MIVQEYVVKIQEISCGAFMKKLILIIALITLPLLLLGAAYAFFHNVQRPPLSSFVAEGTPTPTPHKPSERALKDAAQIYFLVEKSGGDKMVEANWHTTNMLTIINLEAKKLDADPARLAAVEESLSELQRLSSQPISAPVINQPAPVIQNTYPKSCTTNTIGSSTYTNCY